MSFEMINLKKWIIFIIICAILTYMTIEVWGLLPKSQTDPETIEECIDRKIAEHEAEPTAHLGDGESIDVHRKNDVLDHPEGSVVADKFQTGGLTLTYDFSDLARLSKFGDYDNSSWPGVSLWATSGTPYRAYLTSIGSNVRKYIDYSFDWMIQFSFFLGEEGSPTLNLSFGQISSNALVRGVSLDLTPTADKVRWVKTGATVETSDLAISRAEWHTMRIRFSPVEEKLYIYLDNELVATLDEPNTETTSGGSDWTVYLVDASVGEGFAMVEYISVARGN